jgi:hypothetical protein
MSSVAIQSEVLDDKLKWNSSMVNHIIVVYVPMLSSITLPAPRTDIFVPHCAKWLYKYANALSTLV